MKITEAFHNLTYADEGILRTRTFLWILNNLVAADHGKRLADLGAGACIFAKISDRKGYDVTAVDGRTDRVPKDLGKVKFVHSDVRDFDVGEFDVVLIIGLFYHLTLADQIDLLKKSLGRLVIMDTQVHISEYVVKKNSEDHDNFSDRINKSPEGYEGVLFPEGNNPMASIGNTTSWWHTETSMQDIFRNTGFQEITMINPIYVSKYGARRWYVAK